MPIVASAFDVTPDMAVNMLADDVSTCAGGVGRAAFFHLIPGSPMTVPMRFSVPEVLGRMNTFDGTSHGMTTFGVTPPYPKTTYAASALMELSSEALGTSMV